jgi:hypothetical protein
MKELRHSWAARLQTRRALISFGRPHLRGLLWSLKSAVLRSVAQHPGRKVQGPGTTGQSQWTQADAGLVPRGEKRGLGSN